MGLENLPVNAEVNTAPIQRATVAVPVLWNSRESHGLFTNFDSLSPAFYILRLLPSAFSRYIALELHIVSSDPTLLLPIMVMYDNFSAEFSIPF